MKYLRGTVNYGISYSGFTLTLEGYCDANWISNSNETKFTSGYVFTLGGGAVSWRSAKQTIIARSTMKSEFVALELAGLPILTQTLQLKLKASEESVIRIRNQYLALHAKLKEKDETNERSRVYVVDDSVKFKEAVKHGNLIPRYRSIFSDHLTPVLAYCYLVKEDDRESPSFLFDVIEAQPIMEIVAKENMVTIVDHFEGSRTEEFLEDPMINPHKIIEKWKPQCIDELPEAFCGVKKSARTTEEIEKQFGCKLSRLIMVGDRSLTDIVYGNRNGFLTILAEPLSCAEEPLIVQRKVQTDGDVCSGEEVSYNLSTRNEISFLTFARIRPPQNCRGTHRLEQKHFATSGVDFLHKVRRTTRAGQPGLVTSLYKESNRNLVAAIMDETGISCIDERHAHLMLDPSYEPFRKHGSDLI
ncbi:Anthranilate synthase alpha subunit 1, chloroplastic [Capsicum chinense]|nr:Anthranilate synthase alpha subunit 1, chloroplastic [Capsicum chinense]